MPISDQLCCPRRSGMAQSVSCLCIFASWIVVTFASNNEFYKKELFSTKTPYFWARDKRANIQTNEKDEILKDNKTCTVVCVDVVARHGSRYPSLKWIKRFTEIKDKLHGSGTAFIDNWTNRFPEAQAKQLSSTGQEEMYILGKRFATRFKSLLQKNMDRIKSFSSTKQRTIHSASNFSSGLAEVLSLKLSLVNTQNQTLLRFYDFCEKYIKDVDDKDVLEYEKFKKGPEIAKVVRNVNSRVSSGAFNLSIDEVEIIQQICATELQFYQASDWCSLLTEDDLVTIDYMDDIENYWEAGYGHVINYEMSCPLVRHMFNQLDNAIESLKRNNTYTVATFRFGHSGTLFSLYAAFGLFDDGKIFTADDLKDLKNRKFTSSKIMPFSANMALVLYKCSNTDEYLLKILVNEMEVMIPACKKTVCPYNKVRQTMVDYIDNCDSSSRCSIQTIVKPPNSASLLSKIGTLTYLIAIVFISFTT